MEEKKKDEDNKFAGGLPAREEPDKDFLDWYYSCQSDEEVARALNDVPLKARHALAVRKYQHAHREKMQAYTKSYYHAHPEKMRELQHRAYLKRKGKMQPEKPKEPENVQ